MVDIFSIFLLKLEIYFKKLHLLTNWIFLLIEWKKIKMKLDDFRNNGKKKSLSGHFGELLDELLKRISSV